LLDIFSLATAEIVEADHFVSIRQESFTQVAPKKPGPTCYEYSLCHTRVKQFDPHQWTEVSEDRIRVDRVNDYLETSNSCKSGWSTCFLAFLVNSSIHLACSNSSRISIHCLCRTTTNAGISSSPNKRAIANRLWP